MPLFPMQRRGAFGRAYERAQSEPRLTDKPNPAAVELIQRGSDPTQRRGMGGIFGGTLRRLISPDGLQIMGGAMRQIGGEHGALDYVINGPGGIRRRDMERADMERQRAFDEMRAQDWKDERGQRQTQSQALEAAIALLPPEQQVWARLNPAAFAEAMLRRQSSGGEWEVGPGYTNAFRTNPDGTVTLGDELPLRPRAGGRAGGIDSTPPVPDGFDLD